jgi:hypothetical protein
MYERPVESDAERYAGDESFDNAVNDAIDNPINNVAVQPFRYGWNWVFAIGWECSASSIRCCILYRKE